MRVASSPHPWGCFFPGLISNQRDIVFPTPVGVFLAARSGPYGVVCLPHTRGGVSVCRVDDAYGPRSSPHPWGCFRLEARIWPAEAVFPTPVGVFPTRSWKSWRLESLPHTRGGVSIVSLDVILKAESSPHPWGCFRLATLRLRLLEVFPTPVGVFPARPIPPPYGKGLPHTRGGVSHTSEENAANRQSSPHPWGCFQRPLSVIWAALVFPTPVGVFPIQAFVCPDGYRLPHTRGGVSGRQDALECCCLSSPHPWGCFSSAVASGKRRCVFPTPVGVFLEQDNAHKRPIGLPHTRGGVSIDVTMEPWQDTSSPHPWGCFYFLSA